MNTVASGVDVGGTFTDVVVAGAGDAPRAVKVPTTPSNQAVGVAAGIAQAAGSARDAAATGGIAHGTTTATNAVLERATARTVLVTTSGFRDLLTIGRQQRPSLYDLSRTRPPPLVPGELVVGVRERMSAAGKPVVALTAEEVHRVVDAVAAARPESVAVCLLFAYAANDHERTLCDALAARLDVPITRSSELLAEFREYERASTCALNAAVAPVMRRYLSALTGELPGRSITVMTSGGGTAALDAVAQAPVTTLLSGPAAGVVAAAAVACSAGFPDAVALDMGGTSTDVCLIRDGRPAVSASGEIAGLPFATASVDIVTVGAGGGSIAEIDTGGALRVGPRSAGAVPGPACYGHGGTAPTVTDAHCALGHLDPERPLGGGSALDVAAAHRALATLPETAGGAAGVLAVVRATMARALRRVTTERGVDPPGLALVAYGGAGPLSASFLAAELGCAAAVIPPAPGVLSALGLLLAPARHEVSRTVLGACETDRERIWDELTATARDEVRRQGGGDRVTVRREADLRYQGQSHELRVTAVPGSDLGALLHAAHEAAYGYASVSEAVEVVTVRAVAEAPAALASAPARWDLGPARPLRRRRVRIDGVPTEVGVLDRAALRPGDELAGPALVEQPDTTTLLSARDLATVDEACNLVIRVG